MRLGSSAVILSRAFHNNSKTIEELNENVNLEYEIQRLREYENTYLNDRSTLNTNKIEFKSIVDRIVSNK